MKIEGRLKLLQPANYDNQYQLAQEDNEVPLTMYMDEEFAQEIVTRWNFWETLKSLAKK